MKNLLKRWIGLVMAFSMLGALVPVTAGAAGTLSGVKITGIGVEGETLTAVVSGIDIDESQVTYQWFYGPTDTTVQRRFPITGATGKTWKVNFQECIAVSYTKDKFCDYPIVVKATYGGVTKEASYCIAPGRNQFQLAGAQKTTPAENLFTADDGREYILLDSAPSAETGAWFVMAKKDFGSHVFSTDNAALYDSTDTKSIANWLNNGFLTEGNGGQKFTASMIPYLKEHTWKTQSLSATNTANVKGIVTKESTGKLALMSPDEFNRYNGCFGCKDDMGVTKWWLRGSVADKTGIAANVPDKPLGYTDKFAMTSTYTVRPLFYLNTDFFANVKIDALTAGTNVKAAIKAAYPDYKSFNGIYDAGELAALGYEVEAPGYTVSGTVTGGDMLAAAVLSNENASVNAVISGGTITFTDVKPGTYTLKFETNGGYIESASMSGSALALDENNSVSVLITKAVSDLALTIKRDYGMLESVKITGEPVLGAEWKAVWEPAGIPKEELEFTWGYGPGGFDDAQKRTKVLEGVTGDVWTSNFEDLKKAIGSLEDWPVWVRVSYRGAHKDAHYEMAPSRRDGALEGAVETSPAENLFKLKGSDKSFVLLERKDGMDFVIAKDGYGTHRFNATDTSAYNPETEGCIANWLNNGFLTDGNGTGNILPEGIKEFIDKNHQWETYAFADKDVTKLKTAMGVSLLSVNEYNTYYKKIGVGDCGARWWLRSSTNAAQVLAMNFENTFGGMARYNPSNEGITVRPVFWLNEAVYEKYPLDADSLGENVKDLLIEKKDKVKALYTPAEWDKIEPGASMKVTALTMKNSAGQNAEVLEQGKITVTAEIMNSTQNSEAPILFAAFYNGSSLVDVKYAAAALAAGETGSVSVDFTIDAAEPGYRLKAFVWKGLGDLQPVINGYKMIQAPENLPFN